MSGTYEFSVFSGLTASIGSTFSMQSVTTNDVTVADDDTSLSGDFGGGLDRYDYSADWSGQTADLSGGQGSGGKIFAERWFDVTDGNGNTYRLIEIKQQGTGEVYYTFDARSGLPPADAALTVTGQGDVGSSGIDYAHLDGGTNVVAATDPDPVGSSDPSPAPTPPTSDLCDALDDHITVLESEGAGDTETLDSGATSVLTNDTSDGQPYDGQVIKVNGVEGNVGQWVDLEAQGGRVKINADGTVDFDADGDFEYLNAGQQAEVTVDYTIECVDCPPPIIVEDVWFAADCVFLQNYSHPDGGNNFIEAYYDRDGEPWADPGGYFEIYVSFGPDDFPFDATGIVGVDTSSIEDALTALGATTVRVDDESPGTAYNYDIIYGEGLNLTDEQVVEFTQQTFDITVTYLDANGNTVTKDMCINYGPNTYIYSPIAFDLNGDGEIGVTGNSTAQVRVDDAVNATVWFDLNADGSMKYIEWLSGDGDGLLIDTSKIGPKNAVDGSALFGDEGGTYANGFEKMGLLDGNNDGVLDGAELSDLQLWVDDGDAVLEAGELQTLAENSVTSINTGFSDVTNAAGETLMRGEAATGEKTVTEDTATVAIKIEGEDEPVGSISGRYFCDENRDAIEQAGEEGIQEALVTLERFDGTDWLFAASTRTEGDEGLYSFGDLAPDTYRVVFSEVTGKEFVEANVVDPTAVDPEAVDSDAEIDLTDGSSATAPIILGAGENRNDVAAGAAEPAAKIEAIDDFYSINFFDLEQRNLDGVTIYVASFAAGGALESADKIIFNDDDPDDDFDITRVGSESPDSNGDFAAVDGTGVFGAPDFGSISVFEDGSFEFIISDQEAADLFGFGEIVTDLSTQFDYEISDPAADPEFDTALITIEVTTLDLD